MNGLHYYIDTYIHFSLKSKKDNYVYYQDMVLICNSTSIITVKENYTHGLHAIPKQFVNSRIFVLLKHIFTEYVSVPTYPIPRLVRSVITIFFFIFPQALFVTL